MTVFYEMGRMWWEEGWGLFQRTGAALFWRETDNAEKT
jgi:hypothetical protein